MIRNMISSNSFFFPVRQKTQTEPIVDYLSWRNIALHITYKQVWIAGFKKSRYSNVSFIDVTFISTAAAAAAAAVAFNYA